MFFCLLLLLFFQSSVLYKPKDVGYVVDTLFFAEEDSPNGHMIALVHICESPTGRRDGEFYVKSMRMSSGNFSRRCCQIPL